MELLIVCLCAVMFFVVFFLFSCLNKQEDATTTHPRVYPFVGNSIELLRNRHRFLEWSTDYLIKAPGNTITLKRFGDKNVFRVTANPAVVEHILKSNFDNYPKGDHIARLLTDLLGKGIFNADDELWKMQRKLASYEFTTRSLRDYSMNSLADEIQNRLIPTAIDLCERCVKVDLQDLLLRFSFDNICKLAFGIDPACLDSSFPRVRFAEAFDAATGLIVKRTEIFHPIIWKTLKALNLGFEKKLKEALQVVDDFAASVIQSRREKSIALKGEDLLSRFMSIEDGSSFSDKFLRDMVISFVLAGRDTTSVTLSWFFWLLSRHPLVEEKILKEIELITADGTGIPTYEELKKMDYLQAALHETLRLYPAVPVDTKVARNADMLPDGFRVKAGTRVTYHVYAMGRIEEIWGKDCLEFKPERWLRNGEFVSQSPYKFTAFQAGPRICLGKELAMLQMKGLVASLLPKFKLVMAEDGFEPQYKVNITLLMHELPVVFKNR